MRIDKWLQSREKHLSLSGVPFPRRDVLIFVQSVLGLDKAPILAHPELELKPAQVKVLDSYVERRSVREPVQYILGRQEFWGIPVRVGPGCLIPRPETEHMVELALSLVKNIPSPRIVELGTGSGCVLKALATEINDGVFFGIDIDMEALKWAQINTGNTPVVQLLQADNESTPVVHDVDLVVSNPPYVTEEEWNELPTEIYDWEPSLALRCGPEPLGPYRHVAKWAAIALKPGGRLICELGVSQARRASALRKIDKNLKWVAGIRDYSGKLRIVYWEKTG